MAAGRPVAVVGPASVAALAERGIAAPDHRVIAPAGADGNGTDGGANGEDARFDSEALWAQLEPAALNGRAVLIVRGNGGRDWLGDRLREAGARSRQSRPTSVPCRSPAACNGRPCATA